MEHKVKLSRLVRLVRVLQVVTITTVHAHICVPQHNPTYTTLCDSLYCECDPYVRVTCTCNPADKELQAVPEITIRSNGTCIMPYEASGLMIRNCPKVTVTSEALKGLHMLKEVEFVNVKYLSLQQNSLHWNETFASATNSRQGLKFNFTNVTVPDLPSYTFKGEVSEIVFDNAYVGIIRAFAFTSTSKINRITFRKVNVANAEPQSFKKIHVNKLTIDEGRFNVIPSRFLNELTIDEEFSITSTFVDTVKTFAVRIVNPVTFTIANTRMNNVEGEAFHVSVRGDVNVHHNAFENLSDEPFVGVVVENRVLREEGRKKFVFQNNTIGNFRDKSLLVDTNSFTAYYDKLLIDEECTCDNLNKWRVRVISDSLDESLSPYWCHPDDHKEINFVYIQGRLYYEDHCSDPHSSIVFFTLVIVLTAAGVIILTVCIIYLVRHRNKFKKVPTSEVSVREKHRKSKKSERDIIRPATQQHNNNSNGSLILPEGRTYKETEFHVIVEKTEPLIVEPVTTIGKPQSSVLTSDF